MFSFSTFHSTDFFIHRGPIHRERRNYLRTALKEMSLILSDQPGLLGPKVGLSLLSNNTLAFILRASKCRVDRNLKIIGIFSQQQFIAIY